MTGHPTERTFDQAAVERLSRQAMVDVHELELRVRTLEERSTWVTRGQTTASARYVPWEAFRPVQRIVNTTVVSVLGTLIALGLGLGVRWLAGGGG